MTNRRIHRPLSSIAVIAATFTATALLVTTSGATAGAATTPTAAPAVCSGVTNCRVVAHADVDGDGHADTVGWRQVSSTSVQIRVSTAAGKLLTSTVDVKLWWGGGAWAGAAHVDGTPGTELLVGSMQGAHTPMYTMLTYRAGRLAVEKSPSPLSARWQVDAAYGDYMGWWRHTLADGQIAMTQKIAFRTAQGEQFRGHNVTYVSSGTTWVRTTSVATFYPTEKAASAIGGFHVSGLNAFPGL